MSDAIRRAVLPDSLGAIRSCRPLFAAPAPQFSWRALWRGLQRSFRLMVGVQDYQNYRQHMRTHHPDQTPMDERAFHRYCLEARFPGKAGKLGKCPC